MQTVNAITLCPADPGLIPGYESLTNGDIGKKRKMLGEVRPHLFKPFISSDFCM